MTVLACVLAVAEELDLTDAGDDTCVTAGEARFALLADVLVCTAVETGSTGPIVGDIVAAIVAVVEVAVGDADAVVAAVEILMGDTGEDRCEKNARDGAGPTKSVSIECNIVSKGKKTRCSERPKRNKFASFLLMRISQRPSTTETSLP